MIKDYFTMVSGMIYVAGSYRVIKAVYLYRDGDFNPHFRHFINRSYSNGYISKYRFACRQRFVVV